MTRVRIVRGLRPGAAAGNEPAWLAGLDDLERAYPLSNWIGHADVKDPLADSTNAGDTGHHSVYDTYNGMGVDYANGKVFTLSPGGHNDYWGNEVYASDLTVDSPQMHRLRNATSRNGTDPIRFSDGRPSSTHTYCTQLATASGQWFRPTSQGHNGPGSSSHRELFEFVHPTMGLDNTNNDWVDHGDIFPVGTSAGGVFCLYDRNNNHILWCASNNNNPSLCRVNAATKAVVGSNNTNTINDGSTSWAPGFDHTHGCILAKGNSGWWTLRVAAPTAAWQQPSASGDVDQAFFWHEASQAFLTWQSGVGLRKGVLTIDGDGDITNVTWSTVTTTGASIPTVISNNGLNNRCGILEASAWGGNRDVFVAIARYTDPDLFVIPLPEAGV
jgi:hypothetical protein